MCRANRACGPRPRPNPAVNGCGISAPSMPINGLNNLIGCNQPMQQQPPNVGRITNCGETVQTIVEPTVICPPDIYNHFNRVEHIVPVQKTSLHVFHNQHDVIVQEQITVDNVTERHMGPTQTFVNTVQGPSVDMGWVNNFNQTPLMPLQAVGMGSVNPVVNNNPGINQFGINQQVPFVNNNVGFGQGLNQGQLGMPGLIPGLPGGISGFAR